MKTSTKKETKNKNITPLDCRLYITACCLSDREVLTFLTPVNLL